MKIANTVQAVLAIATCLGVLVPSSRLFGQTRVASALPSASPEPLDVSLEENGTLFGLVVDAQGRPLAQTAVTMRQANREVVRFATDREGRFMVAGLRGGTYEIATLRTAGLYRLWAAHTAPPSARPGVLIVDGGPQVRGQQSAAEFLAKPWVLTAVVAAAIAVPVAVANQAESSSRTPASQ